MVNSKLLKNFINSEILLNLHIMFIYIMYIVYIYILRLRSFII